MVGVGQGWVEVPCSELSDKAASASAAAMPLVGSGLGSTGGGSRGASAFSVCSAPGVGMGTSEAGLTLYLGTRCLSWTRPLVVALAPRQGVGPAHLSSGCLCLCSGWNTPQNKQWVLLGNLSSRGVAAYATLPQ